MKEYAEVNRLATNYGHDPTDAVDWLSEEVLRVFSGLPQLIASPQQPTDDGGIGLQLGCRVWVHGLRNARELNGKRGVVVRRQGARWGVRFDGYGSAEPKALLPANLTLLRTEDEAPAALAAGLPRAA
eukprot:gene7702-3604_t